ncbi:MAG: hypothetical protein Q4B73_01290 [Lachnospiraceae bacterium]|nr:hypothetical protein [Lachnospiraceae bacterium]
MTTIEGQESRNPRSPKRRFVMALFALLIAAIAAASATYAWYIYNTSSHTTDVRMAAGTSTQLEIAAAYDGPYGYSVDLDAFVGTLVPVSTDRIQNGFQKVVGYTDGSESKPILANLFAPSDSTDYFKTTLYLRSNAPKQGIYISDITFDNEAEAALMATAIRVGLVVHQPGKDTPVADEYIIEISQEKNPKGQYNTFKGYQGCVLDSTKTDGSVVEFQPLTKANYASYNSSNGLAQVGPNAKKLLDLYGGADFAYGAPVQIDVYVWLEGCDEDCTGYLGSLALKNLAIGFVGIEE